MIRILGALHRLNAGCGADNRMKAEERLQNSSDGSHETLVHGYFSHVIRGVFWFHVRPARVRTMPEASGSC
jgi:hypothetical protein